MLGDYAHTTEVELLLQSSRGESGGGPKPELLELRGKRLVVAGEPPKGARFNAGRVKGMTGNDPITARTLHSPVLVTFTPVFKLWIHTNYPIGAAHDDSGLQRRLRVVPFAAKPARPDPRFKQTLKDDPAARSALLNWAYEGFRAWYAEGYALGESEAVERATGGYWKDQNPYEKFATENLDFDPDGEIFSARLKTMFEDWAEDNGAKLGRSVKLADLHEYLRKHGCEAVKGAKGARKWVGVSERDLPTPTDEQTSAAGGAGGAGGGTSPVFSTYARRDEKNWGNGATSATSATRDDIAPSGQPSGWVGEEL